MSKEEQLKKFLVKISHKLSSTKSNVIKFKGKYYRVKELG